MSAPYESAKPISLSQMRSVQVSMLGRGYSTIVCKKGTSKISHKLFPTSLSVNFNVQQRMKNHMIF
jgi:hypothetical protein